MATIDLSDIEDGMEPKHYTITCDEELAELNKTIDEALDSINQNISAVRRLIAVRDIFRDSNHNT